MGSSLQDQFLKMGLVDKKQVKKAKKQKHDQRKSGKPHDDVNSIAEMSKQAMAEKKKRDLQLNKKKIAAREAKEATAKARQLIDTHKITYDEGGIAYKFTDNNTIKKIYLSNKIINNLASGKIGIVKQAGEYLLVPAAVIYKIRELNDKLVILLNVSSTKNETDEDDPYAEYQVPDDLMW